MNMSSHVKENTRLQESAAPGGGKEEELTVMVRLCRRMPCFLARASSAPLKPWNASASPPDVSTLPSHPLHNI